MIPKGWWRRREADDNARKWYETIVVQARRAEGFAHPGGLARTTRGRRRGGPWPRRCSRSCSTTWTLACASWGWAILAWDAGFAPWRKGFTAAPPPSRRGWGKGRRRWRPLCAAIFTAGRGRARA